MSQKSGKNKNNVTYLNKSKTNKSKANSVRSKKTVKRRKINIKNLAILVLGVLILSFGIIQSTKGITTLVKNISDKVVKTSEAESVELKNQFDLSEEQDSSIKKYTVFIDPGHGGDDNGMQNKETGKYEKEITLDIGKKISSKLSKYNDIDVVISRTDNTKNISTSERLEEATKSNADIIVSLQMNSEYGGNTASGVDIYYKSAELHEGKELATLIQESIKSYVEVKDRGVGMGDFDILKETTLPSVIINCGFITNPSDVKNLSNESYLNEFTEGIAQGILSYIDAHK